MNKFFIILRREYLTRVRKKSFLIMTLLIPLIIVAVGALPALLVTMTNDNSSKEVFVVDQTGLYAPILEQNQDFHFVTKHGTLDQLRSENPKHLPFAYLIIRDTLSKDPAAITLYTTKQATGELSSKIRTLLTPAIRKAKIHAFNVPNLEQIIAESDIHPEISTVVLDKKGNITDSSSGFAQVTGLLFTTFMYLFIIMYGMMVSQSIREEKKNRVVEIIVSSVRPTTLLFGKICAIGLVGLTQLMIWITFILIILFGAQSFFTGAHLTGIAHDIQVAFVADGIGTGILGELLSIRFLGMLIGFIFYFICGYFLYAALFAALSASIDNDEDLGQMIMPITLILLFAYYVGFFASSHPDANAAIWGSMIPFTSPTVMIVRLPFEPPIWQISLSCVILVVSTAFLVWLSAKIYRVGILMYGKKPSFKDLYKWVRYH